MSAERIIVGIAGGTGSGKTTLTNELLKRVGNRGVKISHDDYYRSQDEKPLVDRLLTNYDHPDSLESLLLRTHLELLLKGESIEKPEYSFAEHTRLAETTTINPVDFIFVEGILVLATAELAELLTLKVFVHADADVRLARRISRDVKERGRTMDQGFSQYFSTVKPMHDAYVEPSKKYADIIVHGDENIDSKVERIVSLLTDRVKRILFFNARHKLLQK